MQFQPKSKGNNAAPARGAAKVPEQKTLSRSVEGRAIAQLKTAVEEAFSPRNFLSVPAGAGEALPAHIRTHHETASGVSLHDAQVFRNSPLPERWNAEALTFGRRVFLGPGKERHLAHEAWHVVQQKRKAVHADFRIGKTGVNTSARFENEADRMGALAESHRTADVMPVETTPRSGMRTAAAGVVQGVFVHRGAPLSPNSLQRFASAVQERDAGRLDEFYQIASEPTVPVEIETWLPPSISLLQYASPSDLAPRFTRKQAEPDATHSGATAHPAAASASASDSTAPPVFKRVRSNAAAADATGAAAADAAADPQRARAIIWNMNHFGRRSAANTDRLDQKRTMLRRLMETAPDVVLLNEVNAGVDELQQDFPASSNYALEPGPRMQALGKQDQGTQVEHFPLIYDRRRYRLLRTLIATPDRLTEATGDTFQWRKPENRSAAAAEYPEFRPILVYCLGSTAAEAKEEHWYGAVHTTPDGDEFRRTSIFQDQVRAALANISRAARERGARLFIGGDYYLSPEAVVVSGARNADRNVAEPPTTAQFGLTQAVLDPASSLAQEPPTNIAAIKAAMPATVAAPVFETNRKGDHGQVADLAVIANWTSRRELLPYLQDSAHPQNVDTPDLRFSAPMYAVSDHLPVIFDLSASPDPADAFRRRGAHPDAEWQLRRTMNRAFVLRTLTIAAQHQASAAAAAETKSEAPPALSGSAKYAEILQAKLKLLNRMELMDRLAAVDGSIEPAALIDFLTTHFPEAVRRAGAANLSVFDFETYPT